MGSGNNPTQGDAFVSPAAAAAAIGVALALTAALTAADLRWGNNFNGSPGFPSILLTCWWFKNRKLLWSLAALLVAVTIACGWIEQGDTRSLIHRGLSIIAVIGTATVCHHLLG